MRKVLNATARVGTGALAPIYTVPAGQQATCSTFVAVNTSGATVAVTVRVAVNGEADTLGHTVWSGNLQAGQRLAITEGWALGPGDVVRVNAPATVALTLFGSQVANA